MPNELVKSPSVEATNGGYFRRSSSIASSRMPVAYTGTTAGNMEGGRT